MAGEIIEVNGIAYRHFDHPRYRYILARSYEVTIDIRRPLNHEYFSLSETGLLRVRERYAWDGASGPAPDVPSIMRGSLVHDVAYQSLRERLLPPDDRLPADGTLYKMCVQDGMWSVFARLVYLGVRVGGAAAATPR